VELAKHARDVGAKGICMMAPNYFKIFNEAHLAEIIAAVANEVPDSPFYFYYIPYMSGIKANVKETLDLAKAKAPNIVGCKYTDNDLGDVGLLCRAGY